MSKRGISTVVSTLLIVLLVIIAIGVVWFVIRGVITEGSEGIGFEQFTINLNIEQAVKSDTSASVNVKRGAGEGTLLGIKFVFSDDTQSKSVENRTALNVLEGKTFEFDLTEIGVPDATEVSIAPIYETDSGKEKLGSIVDTASLGSGSISGDGDTGDGAVCGNNIIEGTEVCDGTALGGESCGTQGFDAGTLVCLQDCSGYDTSACTGGSCTDGETQLCPLQEGVCSGSEQTCTDSTWPGCDYSGIAGYEETETTCDDGLDNDCDGLVDSADDDCEATWIGTVGNTWPPETNLYFDIEEETSEFHDLDHTGRYTNFSNVNEARCIQIQDYVTPSDPTVYNKSIVKLDEALVPINITSNDKFQIWEKSQCGV